MSNNAITMLMKPLKITFHCPLLHMPNYDPRPKHRHQFWSARLIFDSHNIWGNIISWSQIALPVIH